MLQSYVRLAPWGPGLRCMRCSAYEGAWSGAAQWDRCSNHSCVADNHPCQCRSGKTSWSS